MRYIRTKDGRISYLSSKPNEELSDYEIITSKGTITYRRENEVVKIADTIEELCDEFRGVRTNYYGNGKDTHEEYHYDKEKSVFYDEFEELTNEEVIEKFDIFYGGIWTDKGLIYVAKMNDKGELELL